jgi:hypothetical protein
MKIQFRQTGGFAGLVKSAVLDTEQMPAEEAEVLEDLVSQSGAFELSAPATGAMPDREQYTLFIESGGRSCKLSLSAGNIPAQLTSLLDYVLKQATYEKRK